MIYLSAQPDEYYFLWQLQLQIHNFSRLGIKPEQIHILICYQKRKGLSPSFKELVKNNLQASFFVYPDERESRAYSSSIRPHAIAAHFTANPWLEQATIFYHDSDIIFNRLPDFNNLIKNKTWYASDTKFYLDSNYILQTAGKEVLGEMCAIVGILAEHVFTNDPHAGGAQYLLKDVPQSFWKKLEGDCEKMFKLLELHNIKVDFSEAVTEKIQSWCTDMWCLWWNSLLLGKSFKITKELGFSWANSPIDWEQQNPILHYTGNIKSGDETLFRKTSYSNCSPFFDAFKEIDTNTSSYTVVREIRSYNHKKKKERVVLDEVTFLIPVRIDSEERLRNVYLVTNYLCHNFKTNVILLEADVYSKIDQSMLNEEVRFIFVEDHDVNFHHTKYNNQLIHLAQTKFISIYDVDIIIPATQLIAAAEAIEDHAMVYPYDGSFVGLDPLMAAMFGKILDAGLFEQNKGKHFMGSRRSRGGCVFLQKEKYILAGMDNEYFQSWGPEDMERWKRMLLLKQSIIRIPGNLYHLPHPRSLNSGYRNTSGKVDLMNEYLKICAMSQPELEKYIRSWPWLTSKQILQND